MVAPFHDPLRLAEDVAVVDLPSKGRLDLVLTNGYVPQEFAMFGRSLAGRPRLATLAVETLRKAWTGEPFEHEGRTVRVTPTPFQPGGPPITLGGSSEAAARRAARIGDDFMPSTPEIWAYYRDEVQRLGRPDPGEYLGGDISSHRLRRGHRGGGTAPHRRLPRGHARRARRRVDGQGTVRHRDAPPAHGWHAAGDGVGELRLLEREVLPRLG